MCNAARAVREVSRLEKRPRSMRVDRGRTRAMTFGVCVSLLAALLSEYVMPLLEIHAPRRGAISIAFISAAIWLVVLRRSDDLAVTPDGLARSMLAELHDGVVLV